MIFISRLLLQLFTFFGLNHSYFLTKYLLIHSLLFCFKNKIIPLCERGTRPVVRGVRPTEREIQPGERAVQPTEREIQPVERAKLAFMSAVACHRLRLSCSCLATISMSSVGTLKSFKNDLKMFYIRPQVILFKLVVTYYLYVLFLSVYISAIPHVVVFWFSFNNYE